MVITHQTLQDFQSCQQYYHLCHHLGKPCDSTTMYHRAIEQSFHLACEVYDSTHDFDAMYMACRSAWTGQCERNPSLKEYTDDAFKILETLWSKYIDYFQGHDFERVAPKKEFELPLHDPTNGDSYTYQGTIAGIVLYENILCVLERRITSEKASAFFPTLVLDRNITGILWATRQLYPETPPQAVLVEAIGKPRGLTAIGWAFREVFPRSPEQLRLWERETLSIVRAITRAERGEELSVRSTQWCENWDGEKRPCCYKAVCMAGGPTAPL